MANTHNTLQLIADILSFEDNQDRLQNKLSSNNDLDDLVINGSKHLTLPAIYCRLSSKNLLSYLPLELQNYLEELTIINRNRNTSILLQLRHIITLFNEHRINYALLKGSALLYANFYKDIGTRMIGDIDILVHPEHLETAYSLLKKEAYIPIESTFGDDFFEHKHLPRLKHDTYICAVEIHRKILSKEVKEYLNPIIALKSKLKVNDSFILCYKDLFHHSILNSEINDQGYMLNTINFRSIYDTLLITNRLNAPLNLSKYQKSYLAKASIYFKAFRKFKTSKHQRFLSYSYKLKQQYTLLHKISHIWHKTRNFCFTILHRLLIFTTNSSYRKAAIKDRKRLTNIIFKKILPFYR
ncbi:nucleotidyltransferase family protein [Pontimicrobium sp. IMCC45349]|uniref:nucleotidyltransferase family protein n=1 Tax=Pontimicrobium sp. IMCC45349 TaxID=3391574 RepID=UPI0039A05865